MLKEKEAGLCSDSNMETENCVDDHADTHSQGFPNKVCHQTSTETLTPYSKQY